MNEILSKSLRAKYGAVVDEKLPPNMAELLARLDGAGPETEAPAPVSEPAKPRRGILGFFLR